MTTIHPEAKAAADILLQLCLFYGSEIKTAYVVAGLLAHDINELLQKEPERKEVHESHR